MRVLLVTPVMDVGGAERVVVDLAGELGRRGIDVAVAAAPGILDAELEAASIVRFGLPRAGRGPLEVAGLVHGIRRAVRRFRPDVVHAQNVKATGAAAAALALCGRRGPLLASFQAVTAAEHAAAARVLRLASAVACVSVALRDELLAVGMPAARLSVVPNGVRLAEPLDEGRLRSLDQELGLGPGPVVSAVGRLVHQKDHDLFLEAATIVSAQRDDVRFLVVGDGPQRDELEQRAAELGIHERVRFTGRRSDARELIARSSLVVFSSRWEGLSLAALEALAAGVPLVSTDVAGMRELLGGGAGVIVRGREPAALAEEVVALLGDPARRDAMGGRGRSAISERFGLDGMVDGYVRLYSALLDGGRGGGDGDGRGGRRSASWPRRPSPRVGA